MFKNLNNKTELLIPFEAKDDVVEDKEIILKNSFSNLHEVKEKSRFYNPFANKFEEEKKLDQFYKEEKLKENDKLIEKEKENAIEAREKENAIEAREKDNKKSKYLIKNNVNNNASNNANNVNNANNPNFANIANSTVHSQSQVLIEDPEDRELLLNFQKNFNYDNEILKELQNCSKDKINSFSSKIINTVSKKMNTPINNTEITKNKDGFFNELDIEEYKDIKNKAYERKNTEINRKPEKLTLDINSTNLDDYNNCYYISNNNNISYENNKNNENNLNNNNSNDNFIGKFNDNLNENDVFLLESNTNEPNIEITNEEKENPESNPESNDELNNCIIIENEDSRNSINGSNVEQNNTNNNNNSKNNIKNSNSPKIKKDFEKDLGNEENMLLFLKTSEKKKLVNKFPFKFFKKYVISEMFNKDIYGLIAMFIVYDRSLFEILIGIIFGLLGMFVLIFSTNIFYHFRIIYWKMITFTFTITMFVLIYTG